MEDSVYLQDKKLTSRFEFANDKRSGLHMAISCRILNPDPSFFSKADSQVCLVVTLISQSITPFPPTYG